MCAFTSFEGARLPIGVRVLAGHAELGVALLVARSPRGAVGPRLLVLDVGLARGRGVGLREVRLVAASTVAKRECAASGGAAKHSVGLAGGKVAAPASTTTHTPCAITGIHLPSAAWPLQAATLATANGF